MSYWWIALAPSPGPVCAHGEIALEHEADMTKQVRLHRKRCHTRQLGLMRHCCACGTGDGPFSACHNSEVWEAEWVDGPKYAAAAYGYRYPKIPQMRHMPEKPLLGTLQVCVISDLSRSSILTQERMHGAK